MIATEQLAAVATATRENPSATALRARFPGLHFTECSEDDVSPRFKPALELERHALYLIHGANGHCLALTNDPAAATGILVAEKGDED